jgi:membrane protein
VKDLISPERRAQWSRWRPTVHYMIETEAHVYALAVAASVLLAFYPFLVVMLSLCRNVLHWKLAVDAIYLALNDYFPGEVSAMVGRNLKSPNRIEYVSLFLLLFTDNGVFEPMEVALNRAWGVKTNRTYLKNQLVSLGLIFACGGLALLSLMLTAMNREWLMPLVGDHETIAAWISTAVFKVAAVPISILALFLIYWLLPNRKIEPRRVVPVAMVVGLILESLKYVNLIVWRGLQHKMEREYGVFRNSVTILIWSAVAALIVLAGAEWTARHDNNGGSSDPLA